MLLPSMARMTSSKRGKVVSARYQQGSWRRSPVSARPGAINPVIWICSPGELAVLMRESPQSAPRKPGTADCRAFWLKPIPARFALARAESYFAQSPSLPSTCGSAGFGPSSQTIFSRSRLVRTVALFCLPLEEPEFSGKGQVCGSAQQHAGRLKTYRYPPPIDIREIKAMSGLPMPAASEPKRLI
jgi:hypothetical protein